MTPRTADVDVLDDIARRVLWLSTRTVDAANRERDTGDHVKVGGHPSRTKDPDGVDFSAGSVGLGAAAPLFAAAARDRVIPGIRIQQWRAVPDRRE